MCRSGDGQTGGMTYQIRRSDLTVPCRTPGKPGCEASTGSRRQHPPPDGAHRHQLLERSATWPRELGYFGDTFGRPSASRCRGLEGRRRAQRGLWAITAESPVIRAPACTGGLGAFRRHHRRARADDIGHVPCGRKPQRGDACTRSLPHDRRDRPSRPGRPYLRELIDAQAGCVKQRQAWRPATSLLWEC